MTRDEKDLLLKDLCARLPYNVKLLMNEDNHVETLYQIDTHYTDVGGFRCLVRTHGSFDGFYDLNEFKPYLRPMSSMTEDERSELRQYCREQTGIIYDIGVSGAVNCTAIIDWLNAHHFDYRGLIEKGLALEAPKNMYN